MFWSKIWSAPWERLDLFSFVPVKGCFKHLILYICTHTGQTHLHTLLFLVLPFLCKFCGGSCHVFFRVESEASSGSFIRQCGSICLVALIYLQGPIYWLICPRPLLMWMSVCFSRWNIQIRPKEKGSAGRPAGALWRLARLPNIRFGSRCFFGAQASALHQQKKDVLSVSFVYFSLLSPKKKIGL